MVKSLATIVVPVDETPYSELIVPVAAALARHTSAEIELITVDSPHSQMSEMRYYHERLAAAHLDGIPWRSRVDITQEGVAETLVRRADEDGRSLLCMSTHARNALGDIVLGSVGDRAVELAHNWLLLVGPKCERTDHALETWLIGSANVFVDGSDLDEHTAEIAMRWAEAVGQRVRFTTIVSPGAPAVRTKLEARLKDLVALASARGISAKWTVVESFDIVGTAVRTTRVSRGSLVVGSHQRSALARMVAGSAAIWASHRATCPVLVAAKPAPVPVVAS